MLAAHRVLLVEDDEFSVVAAKALLEGCGCVVTVARNGRQALRLLAENDGDLIFMDVQMPVMGGMEATKAIRAGEAGREKKDIPIIALTAYAMTGDREHFIAAGMNDYIAKPLDMHHLREVIETAMSAASEGGRKARQRSDGQSRDRRPALLTPGRFHLLHPERVFPAHHPPRITPEGLQGCGLLHQVPPQHRVVLRREIADIRVGQHPLQLHLVPGHMRHLRLGPGPGQTRRLHVAHGQPALVDRGQPASHERISRSRSSNWVGVNRMSKGPAARTAARDTRWQQPVTDRAGRR